MLIFALINTRKQLCIYKLRPIPVPVIAIHSFLLHFSPIVIPFLLGISMKIVSDHQHF